MGARCYVLALLGESPAVLTELLWWLARDGRDVTGIEVWTTGSRSPTMRTGERALRRALYSTPGVWERLLQSVGDSAAARLPPAPAEEDLPVLSPAELVAAPLPPSTGVRPFRVVVPRVGAADLHDVRSPEDAELVVRELHDRVRDLRLRLPPDIQLVGSLAGGRKTMSSALQSAFSLQARPADQLLHVLLHPAIEARVDPPDGLPREFVVPAASVEELRGVPVADQVNVHEVPFAPVRALVENIGVGDVFDAGYSRVLGEVRRLVRIGVDQATGELTFNGLGERASLVVRRGGEVLGEARLAPHLAEAYAALIGEGGFASDRCWWNRMAASPRWSRREKQFKTWVDADLPSAERKISDIKRELKAWSQSDLKVFVPRTEGRASPEGDGRLRRIEAAARVAVRGPGGGPEGAGI